MVCRVACSLLGAVGEQCTRGSLQYIRHAKHGVGAQQRDRVWRMRLITRGSSAVAVRVVTAPSACC
jgi:hypothetical protein